MNKAVLLLMTIVLLSSCQIKDNDETFVIQNLSDSKIEYQKTIVGHLSGEYELANNSYIKSRWSKKERDKTRKYLRALLATLDIIPQENQYISPNSNPAIDLILEPFKGSNIYGILHATKDTNDYIVLGAHFDTGKRNAPGAIDNATGVALIYSVIKELTKLEVRNKNILIVFFDQEEEEQIGSMAFARHIQDKQWNIHSIHCFDMVGWDADADKAMEVFSPSKSLINIYEKVAQRHNVPLKKITIDPIGYDKGSTDFDVFVPLGFNVIGAGECYYHSDSTPFKDTRKDTFETVNFDYLLSCSNLIEDIIKEIVI